MQREAEVYQEYELKEQEMDRELKDSMLKLEFKTVEVDKLALQIPELQNQVATKTKLLEEMKQESERHVNDFSAMCTSRDKVMEDLEAQMKCNEVLRSDTSTTNKEKKFLDTETVRLNTELTRLQHELENERTAADEYKSLLSECKYSLKIAQEKSESLDRELNGMQRAMEIQQYHNQVLKKLPSLSRSICFEPKHNHSIQFNQIHLEGGK